MILDMRSTGPCSCILFVSCLVAFLSALVCGYDRQFWYVPGSYSWRDCSAQCNRSASGGRSGHHAYIRSAADNAFAFDALQRANAPHGFLRGHRVNDTCINEGNWVWDVPSRHEDLAENDTVSYSDYTEELFFSLFATSGQGTCNDGSFCHFASGEPNGFCDCGEKPVVFYNCCIGILCGDICANYSYVCDNLPGETVLLMLGDASGNDSVIGGTWNDVDVNTTTSGCLCMQDITATAALDSSTDTETRNRDVSVSQPSSTSTSITTSDSDSLSLSMSPMDSASPTGSGETVTPSETKSFTPSASQSPNSTGSPTVSPLMVSRSGSQSETASASYSLSSSASLTNSPTPSRLAFSTSGSLVLTSSLPTSTTLSVSAATFSAAVSNSTSQSASQPKNTPTEELPRSVSHAQSTTQSTPISSTRLVSATRSLGLTWSWSLSLTLSRSVRGLSDTATRLRSGTQTVLVSVSNYAVSETRQRVSRTAVLSPTRSTAITLTIHRLSRTHLPSPTHTAQSTISGAPPSMTLSSSLDATKTTRLTQSRTLPVPLRLRTVSMEAKGAGYFAIAAALVSVASSGGSPVASFVLQAAAIIGNAPSAAADAKLWATPLGYSLSPFWDFGPVSVAVGNWGVVLAVTCIQLLAVYTDDEMEQQASAPTRATSGRSGKQHNQNGDGDSDEDISVTTSSEGFDIDRDAAAASARSAAASTSNPGVGGVIGASRRKRWADCMFPQVSAAICLLLYPGAAHAAFRILFERSNEYVVVGVVSLALCLCITGAYAWFLPKKLLFHRMLPLYQAFSKPLGGGLLLRGQWCSAEEAPANVVSGDDGGVSSSKLSDDDDTAASKLPQHVTAEADRQVRRSFGYLYVPFVPTSMPFGRVGVLHAGWTVVVLAIAAIGAAHPSASGPRYAQFMVILVVCGVVCGVLFRIKPLRVAVMNWFAIGMFALVGILAALNAAEVQDPELDSRGDEEEGDASPLKILLVLVQVSVMLCAAVDACSKFVCGGDGRALTRTETELKEVSAQKLPVRETHEEYSPAHGDVFGSHLPTLSAPAPAALQWETIDDLVQKSRAQDSVVDDPKVLPASSVTVVAPPPPVVQQSLSDPVALQPTPVEKVAPLPKPAEAVAPEEDDFLLEFAAAAAASSPPPAVPAANPRGLQDLLQRDAAEVAKGTAALSGRKAGVVLGKMSAVASKKNNSKKGKRRANSSSSSSSSTSTSSSGSDNSDDSDL